MTEDEEKRAAAVLDYISIISDGLSGFYPCRTEEIVDPSRISRIIEPAVPVEDGGSGRPESRLYDAKKDGALLCQNCLPAMNHWYRDKKTNFRCPMNGCPYAMWKGKTGRWEHTVPGYMLVLYGQGMEAFYIRADPPPTSIDNELNWLKLMMNPEDILALIRQPSHAKDIWGGLNAICQKEFAMAAKYFTQAVVKLRKVGDFQVVKSELSLGTDAYGHEINVMMVKENQVHPRRFGEKDWEELVAVLSQHFWAEGASEQTKKGWGQGTRKMANRLCKGKWKGNTAIRPTKDTQHPMSSEEALEEMIGGFGRIFLSQKGGRSKRRR
jgi:hypothetical protein